MNPLTGFIHMGSRLYDPKIGRFLYRDPITGGPVNDYEFAAGDPINRMDPSGLVVCIDDYDGPCPLEPPATAVTGDPGDSCGCFESFETGEWTVWHVRKTGEYFVIRTRTGQLMMRSMSAKYVMARLHYGNRGEYGQLGWSFAEGAPIIRTGIQTGRCLVQHSWGCGVGSVLSVVGNFVPGSAVLLLLNPIAVLSGEAAGGATWSFNGDRSA